MDKVTVLETDNRDSTTTTLVLSNGTKVDVNPVELFFNLIENCYDEGKGDEEDYANLEDWLDTLKNYMNSRK